MDTPRKILVATDGSPDATAALSWAGRLAAALQAHLSVVHCVPPGRPDEESLWHDTLDAWCRPLVSAGVDYERVVVIGDPRERIPEVAARVGVDLVVIGARGEGGHDGLGVGKVAHHLIHQAARPTAIVPGAGGPVAGGAVVVGVDGSEANRRAFEWALATAGGIGAGVEAVFVHDALADSYPHGDTPNWKYRGQRRAEELVAKATPDGGPPVHVDNRGGNAVTVLADFADEVDAAMVVVGTRGHWSFAGAVVGHVPTQLPGVSRVPVVIVPHG